MTVVLLKSAVPFCVKLPPIVSVVAPSVIEELVALVKFPEVTVIDVREAPLMVPEALLVRETFDPNTQLEPL